MVVPAALLTLTVLVCSASAAPTVLERAAAPIPPKQDPWYTAPDDWQDATPGQVLRTRAAPGNLTTVVGNSSTAHNILFRTTDSLGNPTWAVTTLFAPMPLSLPPCAMPPKGYGSLLSYQIPYDSANLNESPSYALYQDPPSDIANSLGKGWYVNVPDFEGPLASFTAGVMSGQATLDSVRAVRAAGLGVKESARMAMWGYSGGALASEWAAELQPSYAPELKFSGAALGGLTPNVTAVLEAVNGQIFAFLAPEGIVGLATQHPAAQKVILSDLKPSGQYDKSGFLAVRNISTDAAEIDYADQNLGDYFTNGLGFINNPAIAHAINTDGIMGRHGIPQMPILAYKAIHDEISPIKATDELVAEYCSKGVSILYERNSVGGHVAEATNGEPAANAFLDSVMKGEYHMQGCRIENVTITIDTSPLRRWAPSTSNPLR